MTNPALYNLSHLELIAIHGEKASDFLQGQVTCDVREITTKQTRYAAHCSAKGRVLSFFRIIQFQKQYYLLAPAVMVDLIRTQLKKYAVFSKVSLELDHTLRIIGCTGTEPAYTLEQILGQVPKNPDEAAYAAEKALLIIQAKGALPRFEIIGENAVMDELWKTLRGQYPEQENECWKSLDIAAGVATIYPETSDLFTPHMLNYPSINAVSFKKGCYIGQEVIARTQYLGKAKRSLHKLILKIEHVPKPGETILNESQESIGIIVESALQKANEYDILAVMHDII